MAKATNASLYFAVFATLGCSSTERQTYDHALKCWEAGVFASQMEKFMPETGVADGLMAKASQVWRDKVMAAGSALGKSDEQIRSDMQTSLQATMARTSDNSGEADVGKFRDELKSQMGFLKSCSDEI